MVETIKIIEVIATVVILILLGFLAKKTGIAKKEHNKVLNNIIIYLTMPPLIFIAIRKADLSIKLVQIPLIGILTIAIVLAIAFAAGKVLKFDSKLFGSFLLVAAIGNTGYLGYPLASKLAGNEGLTKAIFYDIFGTVLAIFTVGLIIAEFYGGRAGKIDKVKEIITFPPFIALLMAFILKPLVLPAFITDMMVTIGSITIPLIMISVGLSLEAASIGKYLIPVSLAFVLKLILSPVVAFMISSISGLSQSFILITVLEAAMPPALLSLVFGLKYELDNDFLASVIFALTAASAVTVPLVLIAATSI